MRKPVMAFEGGIWSPSKALRDSSWWHQWKRERACSGHQWQPEAAMGVDWFCSSCGKESDSPNLNIGVRHG